MSTIKIKLNLVPGDPPGGILPRVRVSQNDNTDRILQFELYDGNAEADLSGISGAYIGGLKPDGNGFTVTCAISGNMATAILSVQSTVLAGDIPCKLYLIYEEGSVRSATFTMQVDPDPLNAADYSETEVPDIINFAREAAERAGESADAAATSESNAAASATAAANSATAAATNKSDSEAYAIGERNGSAVPSTDPTYHNNSKYYSEVAQQAAAGGLIPQGTVAFANLPPLASANVGDMWNISDGFTTTSDFREGAGEHYGPGADVYKTADGYWDVLADVRVTMTGATATTDGADGECIGPQAGDEDKYWTGAARWKDDTSKLITKFTSSDINAGETAIITSAGGETAMPAMTGGDTQGSLFVLISKAVRNIRKLINTVKRIWQTVANAWVSGASYSVGQVVTYTNGHTYICKTAHTSSASITPGNTTYWDDKSIGDMIASLNSNYANETVFQRSATAVGKWIDGKAIYRRVIYVASLQTDMTLISNANIKDFIRVYGSIYNSDHSILRPFGECYGGNTNNVNTTTALYLRDNTVKVDCRNEFVGQSADIVIEYTTIS